MGNLDHPVLRDVLTRLQCEESNGSSFFQTIAETRISMLPLVGGHRNTQDYQRSAAEEEPAAPAPLSQNPEVLKQLQQQHLIETFICLELDNKSQDLNVVPWPLLDDMCAIFLDASSCSHATGR